MEHDQESLETRIAHLEDQLGENTRMVRALYRAQRWAFVYRIVYWVIIIGLALGAFYFIQPYLTALTGAYETVSGQDSVLLRGFGDQLERIQDTYRPGPWDGPSQGTGGQAATTTL
jgi:hypothetical protein